MNFVQDTTLWLKSIISERSTDAIVVNAVNFNYETLALIKIVELLNFDTFIYISEKNLKFYTPIKKHMNFLSFSQAISPYLMFNMFEKSFKTPFVISGLTKNETEFIRPYHKTALLYDALPFMNFYLSELIKEIELSDVDVDKNLIFENMTDSNFSYADAESLGGFNQSCNGIITDFSDPSKNKFWYKLMLPQRQLISKAHYEEKQTKFKKLDHIPSRPKYYTYIE